MITRLCNWSSALWIFLSLLPATAADTPKMFATHIEIPERGEVPGYLFVIGTNKFTFMTPAGWKPEGKLDRREVIFISADLDASLTFKVTDIVKELGVEETRQKVQQQFTNGKLIHEFPCYVSGRVGRGFEVEQMAAEKARINIRYGIVPLPGGTAEFILRAPAARIRDLDVVFGQFLASLQVEGHRPRK